MKLSDDLTLLTTKLMLVREKRDALNLASEFNSVIAKVIERENEGAQYAPERKAVTTTLKFNLKEISKMSPQLKKCFILHGLVVRLTRRASGKDGICYELRYRADGYNIHASSTDFKEAKKKFLFKTTPGEIEKYRVNKEKSGFDLLREVFDEWHSVKKGTLTDKEHRRFYVNFQTLPETLRNKPIATIRTTDLNSIMQTVTPRKYEELRTLFNGIFKYAVASGIIQHNPVSLIKFKRAERKNRDALILAEIHHFFEYIVRPEFEPIRQAAYILYFFGTRPCEIDEETHLEGDFLVVRNRKRKNGKIEYKKIPVPKQAQGFIDWGKPLTFQCSRYMQNELFKKLLVGKTAYYLRHTFATVCQEFVRPDIVDIWMGDSPDRLVGKVYTHFSDKFMHEQMDKVDFPIFESPLK